MLKMIPKALKQRIFKNIQRAKEHPDYVQFFYNPYLYLLYGNNYEWVASAVESPISQRLKADAGTHTLSHLRLTQFLNLKFNFQFQLNFNFQLLSVWTQIEPTFCRNSSSFFQFLILPQESFSVLYFRIFYLFRSAWLLLFCTSVIFFASRFLDHFELQDISQADSKKIETNAPVNSMVVNNNACWKLVNA